MNVYFLLVVVLVSALGATINRNQPSPRVVGGEDATDGQFPHQLTLQWTNIDKFIHVCGASIISPTWILTAGHCKTELPDDGRYIAIAGISNLNQNGQTRDVVEIIVHPDYQGGATPNDIALMRVSEPFAYDANVQPISLPVADAIPSGDAIISGWGSISTTEEYIMPEQLQTAVLPVLSRDECKQAVSDAFGNPDLLADSNICTGPLDGSKGACSADSGGPLIQGNEVIGIVSWGHYPCGEPGAPSVYVRTSAFIDFIHQHVTDL